VGAVTATIAIDASPETILAILLDITAYPSWQKGIDKIEIQDTDEQGRPRNTRWHVNAMGQRATHTVRYEYPADGCFGYHLVESEVLTKYDFGCTVATNGGGTSEVTVSQELGIKWAMPQFILDKNAKKGINTMLNALKAKAEQA
jgi:hypothetical protein